MTALAQKMTAEELLQLPDDDFRYELVRGVLRKMVPAGNEHGQIALRLAWRLAQYVETNKLGVTYAAETGFILALDPDTVRAPDAAFVRQERLDEIGKVAGFWPGAPDLVIEVISPSDQYSEVESKVADWLKAGSRMVVVVDPRRRVVAVHHSRSGIRVLGMGEVLEGGDVVPGWSVPIEELFA